MTLEFQRAKMGAVPVFDGLTEMINLTREQINCAILIGKLEEGLKKYYWLQNSLYRVNVETNREFQRRFNNFYIVRRNNVWRTYFYSLMEGKKKSGISFDEALKIINDETGQYEASFASKLVATIDPSCPVIDKFVLENVNLKLPYTYAKSRQEKICNVYQKLQTMFQEYLETANGEYLVSKFKAEYPWADITKVKMLDLILWQTRLGT